MTDNVFVSYTNIELSDVLDKMGDAICVTDAHMNIHSANRAFAKMYGVKVEDVLGKNAFDIYPNFKKSVFYEVAQNTMGKGIPTTRVGYSANTQKWLVTRGFKYDENNYVLAVHEMSRDEERVGYMNKKDTLTSLGNRFAFEQDIKDLIRLEQNFGLLLIDLNRFHIVNETLGFHVGDMFLMEIASKMKQTIFAGNRLYRIGGDQFLLLNLQSELIFKEEIKNVLENFNSPIKYSDKEYLLQTTSGYLFYNNFKEEIDSLSLLKNLELTLVEAKKRKIDLLEFDPSMDSRKNKLEMEKDLRKAIAENQLELFYQPQCDLITGKVCGAEALIRWQHPEKGFMSPADFLPLAEELNLMKDLDKWVFKRSLADNNDLVSNNISLSLSVNLSADSVSSHDMLEFFETSLKQNGMRHDMLTFEITETSVMNDVEKSKEVIASITKKGAKIAIDDFGTGYSSMEYLIKYPSDYLKIDREFIKEISNSKTHKIMVANIIKMGHSLGMTIVAEGVETQEEMDILKKMDCDIVQGYFYAKPMNFQKFKEFIATKGISSLKSAIV